MCISQHQFTTAQRWWSVQKPKALQEEEENADDNEEKESFRIVVHIIPYYRVMWYISLIISFYHNIDGVLLDTQIKPYVYDVCVCLRCIT